MANSSTTKNVTAQAPAWVYATDPDEGIVYCLCCHAGTDPQDAFERPNQRNHHEDCNAVAIYKAVREMAKEGHAVSCDLPAGDPEFVGSHWQSGCTCAYEFVVKALKAAAR